MIKQCKGKDINKIPKSKLCTNCKYLVSTKYDGHYVQIHKTGKTIRFFTGGGKEFYLKDLAIKLITRFSGIDFILEAEFIGENEGKLGDRTKVGILTTWRTNFKKGLSSVCGNNKFKVFDIILENIPFSERLATLKTLNLPNELEVVDFKEMTLPEANKLANKLCNKGWEGLYLKNPNHVYLPGKRVNNAIKLKRRPTADLLCIGIEDGEGKYEGKIGSLVLKDSNGIIVKVGSGLQDWQREVEESYYVGKIIEIEYEQILDTYIQPTFVRIRTDKTKED